MQLLHVMSVPYKGRECDNCVTREAGVVPRPVSQGWSPAAAGPAPAASAPCPLPRPLPASPRTCTRIHLNQARAAQGLRAMWAQDGCEGGPARTRGLS